MNTAKTIQSEIQTVSILSVIASYYSRMLEQAVSVDQTKSLISAQCAFLALVLPFDLGYTYRIVTLLWFVYSVLQCKIKMS